MIPMPSHGSSQALAACWWIVSWLICFAVCPLTAFGRGDYSLISVWMLLITLWILAARNVMSWLNVDMIIYVNLFTWKPQWFCPDHSHSLLRPLWSCPDYSHSLLRPQWSCPYHGQWRQRNHNCLLMTAWTSPNTSMHFFHVSCKCNPKRKTNALTRSSCCHNIMCRWSSVT